MYNAAFVREMLDVAPAYGFRVPSDVPFSWADLKERRDAHVRKLNEIYLRNLAGSGVEHVEGVAEFVGPKEVRVNDRRYRVRRHACDGVMQASTLTAGARRASTCFWRWAAAPSAPPSLAASTC